jgi:RNA polymerase sigma factor (sigma-70 family)
MSFERSIMTATYERNHPTPDQFKLPPESASIPRTDAWEVVLDHRALVYSTFRKVMSREIMKRNIGMEGTILTPSFRWSVAGTWFGRPARDVLEEIMPGVLEHALRAVESWDSTRESKLSTHIATCVRHGTFRELERWQRTMSSEEQASLDSILAAGISPEQLVYRDHTTDDIALRENRELTDDPTAEHVEAKLLVEHLMRSLTPKEGRVLQYRTDGWSFDQIGAELGVSRQNAQQTYRTAVARARRILS